jgi:hypothetical protein
MRSGPSWRRCCRRSAPGWAAQGPPADRGSDRVAGPHRRALAGPARRVRPLGDGGQPVLPLAPPGRVGPVLQALQADADARGELDWLLHFVDGSVVRAHQHASGARRRPPAADLAAQGAGAPADPDQQGDREREREALGRSRAVRRRQDRGGRRDRRPGLPRGPGGGAATEPGDALTGRSRAPREQLSSTTKERVRGCGQPGARFRETRYRRPRRGHEGPGAPIVRVSWP